jgi:tripartite-type tricarboxylate transporter receptor subunit TctC
MMDRRGMLLGAAAALGSTSAAAQPGNWPARSMRMIIPWPPGQATDVQGRLMAQRLSERLGHTVVPENRPGAGGQIGTDLVAKSAPDGYTLLAASIGPITFQPLVARPPYDVERDLAPVAGYGSAPFMLLVRPDFPARDAASFIALLKANPGKYTHNSSGVGGAQHLVTALFNAKAGIDALHVPFAGSGQSIAALLGGQVSYGIDTPAAAGRLVADGQLRALGLTTGRPSPLVPGIPPLAAVANIGEFDIGGWNGLMVRAGTPREIVDRLSAEAMEGLLVPEIRDRFAAIGVEVEPRGPEAFMQQIRDLWALFRPLITQLGIRAE